MKNFDRIFIKGTSRTPEIDFNQLTGELVLNGRSIPENAVKLYEPLLEWTSEYIKEPYKNTNFHLKLEYFNSSSLIWIITLIKLLSKINKKGSTLLINLYFENDDFDFENKEVFKDLIHSIFDNIQEPKVIVGIKINGTDSDGKVVDEETIFV